MASSPHNHRRPVPRRLPRLSGLIAVGAGGLIGSAARAGIGYWLPVPEGGFPTATLIVNLTGSFLLGIYLVRRERAAAGGRSLRFWAFGLFGSFTTFSAFSLEVVRLVVMGNPVPAVAYVVASVIGGLFAAFLAQRLVSALP